MHSITKRTAVLSAATAAVALIGAGCSHATKAGQTASSPTTLGNCYGDIRGGSDFNADRGR